MNFPGSQAEGCRWLSKKGGDREIKIAKPKGKKQKPSTKLASAATTKLYKKLEEETLEDMIEMGSMAKPPSGWQVVDLEQHLGPGEQGLVMLRKHSDLETVSVLSSPQFVGNDEDFEDDDEDSTRAPSFVCLLVIDRHTTIQQPIFAQCIVEEEGPRIDQLSIGMGMPGSAHNPFGPFNFVYQTYAMIASQLGKAEAMQAARETREASLEDDMKELNGLSEEEAEAQMREFEQSLSREDKDHLAAMQKFAREHMEKMARGEEISEEELKNSPLNPDNNPFAGRFTDQAASAGGMQQQPSSLKPAVFAPEMHALPPKLQQLLHQLVRERLGHDVIEYLLQTLAMQEQAGYQQFLTDTKQWVNPLP